MDTARQSSPLSLEISRRDQGGHTEPSTVSCTTSRTNQIENPNIFGQGPKENLPRVHVVLMSSSAYHSSLASSKVAIKHTGCCWKPNGRVKFALSRHYFSCGGIFKFSLSGRRASKMTTMLQNKSLLRSATKFPVELCVKVHIRNGIFQYCI